MCGSNVGDGGRSVGVDKSHCCSRHFPVGSVSSQGLAPQELWTSVKKAMGVALPVGISITLFHRIRVQV